jgi:hypothetical protein
MQKTFTKLFLVNSNELLTMAYNYYHLPPVFHKQHYNLFNVDQRILPHNLRGATKSIVDYGTSFGYKLTACYYVWYSAGSYCKLHSDNASMTVVTVVEQEDLIGGETIFVQDDGAHRIVKMEEGDSVVYSKGALHAVGLVESGHRLVQICWFNV